MSSHVRISAVTQRCFFINSPRGSVCVYGGSPRGDKCKVMSPELIGDILLLLITQDFLFEVAVIFEDEVILIGQVGLSILKALLIGQKQGDLLDN